MRGAKRERNLREVRAVLERLQRIASEPEDTGESPPGGTRGAGDTSRAAKVVSVVFSAARARPAAAGGAAFLALALLVLAAAAFWRSPAQAPAQPLEESAKGAALPAQEPPRGAPERAAPPPSGDVLKDAQLLMAEGHVLAAREALLQAGDPPLADVALAIARSYDPTFLRSIPAADAAADIGEAERWYRRWRDIAVKDGLAMDEERLQRILRAMR